MKLKQQTKKRSKGVSLLSRPDYIGVTERAGDCSPYVSVLQTGPILMSRQVPYLVSIHPVPLIWELEP